jgi:hypothetical protein
MQYKTINLVLLAIILSGCAQKNNVCISTLDLPPLPMPGKEVADELEPLCSPTSKCEHYNNWLNQFYLFADQYNIYRGMKYDKD